MEEQFINNEEEVGIVKDDKKDKDKFAKPNSTQFIYHNIRRKNKRRKEESEE